MSFLKNKKLHFGDTVGYIKKAWIVAEGAYRVILYDGSCYEINVPETGHKVLTIDGVFVNEFYSPFEIFYGVREISESDKLRYYEIKYCGGRVCSKEDVGALQYALLIRDIKFFYEYNVCSWRWDLYTKVVCFVKMYNLFDEVKYDLLSEVICKDKLNVQEVHDLKEAEFSALYMNRWGGYTEAKHNCMINCANIENIIICRFGEDLEGIWTYEGTVESHAVTCYKLLKKYGRLELLRERRDYLRVLWERYGSKLPTELLDMYFEPHVGEGWFKQVEMMEIEEENYNANLVC